MWICTEDRAARIERLTCVINRRNHSGLVNDNIGRHPLKDFFLAKSFDGTVKSRAATMPVETTELDLPQDTTRTEEPEGSTDVGRERSTEDKPLINTISEESAIDATPDPEPTIASPRKDSELTLQVPDMDHEPKIATDSETSESVTVGSGNNDEEMAEAAFQTRHNPSDQHVDHGMDRNESESSAKENGMSGLEDPKITMESKARNDTENPQDLKERAHAHATHIEQDSSTDVRSVTGDGQNAADVSSNSEVGNSSSKTVLAPEAKVQVCEPSSEESCRDAPVSQLTCEQNSEKQSESDDAGTPGETTAGCFLYAEYEPVWKRTSDTRVTWPGLDNGVAPNSQLVSSILSRSLELSVPGGGASSEERELIPDDWSKDAPYHPDLTPAKAVLPIGHGRPVRRGPSSNHRNVVTEAISNLNVHTTVTEFRQKTDSGIGMSPESSPKTEQAEKSVLTDSGRHCQTHNRKVTGFCIETHMLLCALCVPDPESSQTIMTVYSAYWYLHGNLRRTRIIIGRLIKVLKTGDCDELSAHCPAPKQVKEIKESAESDNDGRHEKLGNDDEKNGVSYDSVEEAKEMIKSSIDLLSDMDCFLQSLRRQDTGWVILIACDKRLMSLLFRALSAAAHAMKTGASFKIPPWLNLLATLSKEASPALAVKDCWFENFTGEKDGLCAVQPNAPRTSNDVKSLHLEFRRLAGEYPSEWLKPSGSPPSLDFVPWRKPADFVDEVFEDSSESLNTIKMKDKARDDYKLFQRIAAFFPTDTTPSFVTDAHVTEMGLLIFVDARNNCLKSVNLGNPKKDPRQCFMDSPLSLCSAGFGYIMVNCAKRRLKIYYVTLQGRFHHVSERTTVHQYRGIARVSDVLIAASCPGTGTVDLLDVRGGVLRSLRREDFYRGPDVVRVTKNWELVVVHHHPATPPTTLVCFDMAGEVLCTRPLGETSRHVSCCKVVGSQDGLVHLVVQGDLDSLDPALAGNTVELDSWRGIRCPSNLAVTGDGSMGNPNELSSLPTEDGSGVNPSLPTEDGSGVNPSLPTRDTTIPAPVLPITEEISTLPTSAMLPNPVICYWYIYGVLLLLLTGKSSRDGASVASLNG